MMDCYTPPPIQQWQAVCRYTGRAGITNILGDPSTYLSAERLRLDGLCGGLAAGESIGGNGRFSRAVTALNWCSRDAPPGNGVGEDGRYTRDNFYELGKC
jgi:hypothetical protein